MSNLYRWRILSTDYVRLNGECLELAVGDILTIERPVKDGHQAYVRPPRLSDEQRAAKKARELEKLYAYDAGRKAHIAALTGEALEAHRSCERAKGRSKYAKRKARVAALSPSEHATHMDRQRAIGRTKRARRVARSRATQCIAVLAGTTTRTVAP